MTFQTESREAKALLILFNLHGEKFQRIIFRNKLAKVFTSPTNVGEFVKKHFPTGLVTPVRYTTGDVKHQCGTPLMV